MECDYSQYLGPDYKKEPQPTIASTIVANHVAWFDALAIYLCYEPSFCPQTGLKSIPGLTTIFQAVDSIFIPRDGEKATREQVIQMIADRQQQVLDGKAAPLIIFPEGGISNGAGLIKFKRGAFQTELAVKPVIMKFEWSYNSPDWTIDMMPLLILQFASFQCMKVTVHEMPIFQPNEYLFEHHRSCEQHRSSLNRWEIYAWSVRDAMLKAGKLRPDKFLLRQKIVYDRYMAKTPGAPEPPRHTSLNAWINLAQAKVTSREASHDHDLEARHKSAPSGAGGN